jgi:hypothetical protein
MAEQKINELRMFLLQSHQTTPIVVTGYWAKNSARMAKDTMTLDNISARMT